MACRCKLTNWGLTSWLSGWRRRGGISRSYSSTPTCLDNDPSCVISLSLSLSPFSPFVRVWSNPSFSPLRSKRKEEEEFGLNWKVLEKSEIDWRLSFAKGVRGCMWEIGSSDRSVVSQNKPLEEESYLEIENFALRASSSSFPLLIFEMTASRNERIERKYIEIFISLVWGEWQKMGKEGSGILMTRERGCCVPISILGGGGRIDRRFFRCHSRIISRVGGETFTTEHAFCQIRKDRKTRCFSVCVCIYSGSEIIPPPVGGVVTSPTHFEKPKPSHISYKQDSHIS